MLHDSDQKVLNDFQTHSAINKNKKNLSSFRIIHKNDGTVLPAMGPPLLTSNGSATMMQFTRFSGFAAMLINFKCLCCSEIT